MKKINSGLAVLVAAEVLAYMWAHTAVYLPFAQGLPIQMEPTPPPTPIAPYPAAPLCPDTGGSHDNSQYHTLWDYARGCHYDHEHGDNPFTQAVDDAFPGLDLYALLGNVQIGHTNPSGPAENAAKHGGFKWNVQLAHPQGCQGFEGAVNGVNGSVIQYHNFGDYSVELESEVHSTVALLRQCNAANPTDYGYVYTVQLQNYGQVVVPYQGTVFVYPYYSVPLYDSRKGQYISVACIGAVTQCRSSLGFAQANTADSNWTSKITGSGPRPVSSSLFALLFRIRDTYQMYDWNDQAHPFTLIWLCTSDGGLSFNSANCRYNNSTTQVHEIAGEIPAAWDNLAGFDTDGRVGRITADGFTTRYGDLNTSCTAPGPDCYPLKMVGAFVGTYGSVLVCTGITKCTNIVPVQPERDIYFCYGTRKNPVPPYLCTETGVGARPAGWIGPVN